jgi:flagellin
MANVDVTRVAGNIGALNALNSLQYVNQQLAVHQTRLATGKRINEAADDPAGTNMAITFDIRRNDMKVAISAIGDSKNLLSVAETGLRKISDLLTKMKSKVMEAAGATIGDTERDAVAAQLNSYTEEIDQIIASSNWNGVDLIGTSSSATKSFFVGVSGSGAAVFANFAFSGAGSAGFTAGALGLAGSGAAVGVNGGFSSAVQGATGSAVAGGYTRADLQFSGSSGAASTTSAGSITLSTIGSAIARVKAAIVDVGAMSARLTFKEDTMQSAYINTEAAYNRIMNANMAEEQVEASKYAILQQSATAMLAQANAAPQFLLQLLG